jgi:glucose/arabinose dehydrogenase
MAAEEGRAAIWEYDLAGGRARVYASGLRNPNGLAWEPKSGALWTVVNERDEIGDDLVPDYMTSVQGGGFYGWPYSYYGQHGSWNRRPLNGYRVVFVPFQNGRPTQPAQVFLSGFLSADGKIQGRPVGVAVDKRGGLLVADDAGGIVWRVAPASLP